MAIDDQTPAGATRGATLAGEAIPLREQLAEYAHDAWSGWMKYLFDKGHYLHDTQPRLHGEASLGTRWVMPAWAVERWTRQMNTPYAKLPEGEKESDRQEADAMLALMEADRAAAAVREAELLEMLERRQRCEVCSGSGLVWFAALDGDGADPDPCECWSNAEDLLAKFEKAKGADDN